MKDIDAVIAWVDGDDPKHIKKRKLYLSSDNEDKNDDDEDELPFGNN